MSRASKSPWVTARNSKIHGKGLYARTPIPAGIRVIEYQGERITKAESRRRELRRLEAHAKGRPSSIFLFTLNKRHDIDGSTPANLARLINHSCTPNCESRILRGKIWIISKRDIEQGAELSFDYGFPVVEWRDHPCLCGSDKCAGYIVAKAQRRHLRKRIRVEKLKVRSQRNVGRA